MTEFDQITLICRICKAEHVSYPDQALRTDQLKGYLDTRVFKFCDCPSQKCDVKLRIKGKADDASTT